MKTKQRVRHSVLPERAGGSRILSRNELKWDDKLFFDLEYINHVTLAKNMEIIMWRIFLKRRYLYKRYGNCWGIQGVFVKNLEG